MRIALFMDFFGDTYRLPMALNLALKRPALFCIQKNVLLSRQLQGSRNQRRLRRNMIPLHPHACRVELVELSVGASLSALKRLAGPHSSAGSVVRRVVSTG